MVLKKGDIAPEFETVDSNLKPKKLRDYRGNKVVLAFFPGAFTGVCTKEMCNFRDSMQNFNRFNAKVVGISVDQDTVMEEIINRNIGAIIVSVSAEGLGKDFLGREK